MFFKSVIRFFSINQPCFHQDNSLIQCVKCFLTKYSGFLIFYTHCLSFLWLKTTQIYFTIVIQGRSPKSVYRAKIKVLEGLVSSGGFKRDSVPCFFLGTRGYPHSMTHGLIQHHFFYLISLHSSFHFCHQISLCLFLRTMMISLRDHQDNLG